MKKFYSILAFAFMCMVGVANAETVKFEATYVPTGFAGLGEPILTAPYEVTTSDGKLTFYLEGIQQREDAGGFFAGSRCPYWIDKQPDSQSNTFASLKVKGLNSGESVNLTINFSAACKALASATHSCTVVSSSDGASARIYNHAFRLGFRPYTLTTTNFTNESEILFSNGGGACGFDEITITYEVIEDKSVVVTPNNEVIFSGNWNAAQISEVIENPLSYVTVGVDEETGAVAPVPVVVQPGQFGVIDVTGVTGDLNSRQPIMTVNPNTIIAVTPDQPSVRPTNVLVMDEQDPYVENLVVVDPSLGTNTQSGSNYDEVDCGWYCTRSFTAKKASYTRPMGYSYGTVVLPFAYNVAGQSHQIEEITEVAEETITSKRVEVEAIRPCQPVIVWSATPKDVVITAEDTYVMSPQGRDASTLIGTLTETTIGEGQYFIAKDNFWHAGDYQGITVKPFRAWFEGATEMAVKSFSINGESATAIKNVESTTTAAPAYNLQGVRVAPNAKGFVIINGKKTYNK